ncbi:hypothetical protein [Candidatus Sneabacter namystus]|uniref:Phage gp6-like head-tail connector protein n=1 Tax=Candidatus Sneabacter namystus TaxID=2601646 RepID=A0A5C0UIY3_9RICK|nr:hypothetical protein [Candidatus Sneabacter namystus]QEK39747.1 hypothetical protein FZC37_02300 [Candidatus Sneabacter namystus]
MIHYHLSEKNSKVLTQTRTTQNASYLKLITLDTIKKHLWISEGQEVETQVITDLLQCAVDYAEDYLNQQLIDQIITYKIRCGIKRDVKVNTYIEAAVQEVLCEGEKVHNNLVQFTPERGFLNLCNIEIDKIIEVKIAVTGLYHLAPKYILAGILQHISDMYDNQSSIAEFSIPSAAKLYQSHRKIQI